MKKLSLCLIIFCLILGAGISQAEENAGKKDAVLATVGDKAITREMVDNIIETIPEQNRVPFMTPDGRKKILEEMISFTLFAQGAKNKGIDKEPAVQTRLSYVQTEFLARELFRRLMEKEGEITEEEMKAYYEAHKEELRPPVELQLRHVLVATEQEAKKVLEQIKKGKDLAEVAKTESIDPSAVNGGKLLTFDGREWLPKGTFENSFEEAVSKIDKGEVGGPIKSQFGWHIVKVEDRRQLPPPEYIRVRPMIQARLRAQKTAAIHEKTTQELKKKFPVTIK